jgi:uncharacterized protein (DUF1697 family)
MIKGRVIALFRAVNVGGRMVRMADLEDLLLEIGLKDPQTLLQSGNAVFGVDATAARGAPAALEARIERALLAKTGIQSDTFVRTAAEWDAAIVANPFEEQRSDPSHMILTTLRAEPSAARVKALRASIKGPEVMHAHGRALYVVYPDGMGQSKLTNVVIERALDTRATARNWNTVLKLQALVAR